MHPEPSADRPTEPAPEGREPAVDGREPAVEDRVAALARVHGGLSVVARRGSPRNRRVGAVSQVDQTLLRMLADQPGARVVDIAEYFGFNRSTASRQTAALIEAGFVEEAPVTSSGGARSGRPLRLTERGARLLQDHAESMRAVTAARMRDWATADIAAFAAILERYNGGPEA